MAKEKVTVFGGLFCCGSDRCMMKLVAPEHKAKLFGTKGGKKDCLWAIWYTELLTAITQHSQIS